MWKDLQKAFNRALYYNSYNKALKEPLDVDKWKSMWITRKLSTGKNKKGPKDQLKKDIHMFRQNLCKTLWK
jgi:hypothetical protein